MTLEKSMLKKRIAQLTDQLNKEAVYHEQQRDAHEKLAATQAGVSSGLLAAYHKQRAIEIREVLK